MVGTTVQRMAGGRQKGAERVSVHRITVSGYN